MTSICSLVNWLMIIEWKRRPYGFSHFTFTVYFNSQFSENASDELTDKKQKIKDNKLILDRENMRLEAIRFNHKKAQDRQEEIVQIHEEEQLKKLTRIKELERTIRAVDMEIASKKVSLSSF